MRAACRGRDDKSVKKRASRKTEALFMLFAINKNKFCIFDIERYGVF